MIRLTRLNGKEFVLNSDLIKIIEATPDTVITLTQGDKLMVRESVERVVEVATDYRQRLSRESPEDKLSK
jgi:flagellar protein FlbD